MTPNAYPLQWPVGWPKTEPARREHARFKTTLSSALNNLKTEIGRMGGANVVLSSNYTLGCENPRESGVVAYFTWQGVQMAIPCDRWVRVEQNVQAIALTVEAMRGMERWGAKHMIKAMFTGFKALPASSDWRTVLGVTTEANASEIRGAYLELVKKHHPDTGGSHEEFVKIQNGYDQARQAGLTQ